MCKDHKMQNKPVIEHAGKSIKATISDLVWAGVAPIYHPIEKSLSVWVEFEKKYDRLLS